MIPLLSKTMDEEDEDEHELVDEDEIPMAELVCIVTCTSLLKINCDLLTRDFTWDKYIPYFRSVVYLRKIYTLSSHYRHHVVMFNSVRLCNTRPPFSHDMNYIHGCRHQADRHTLLLGHLRHRKEPVGAVTHVRDFNELGMI